MYLAKSKKFRVEKGMLSFEVKEHKKEDAYKVLGICINIDRKPTWSFHSPVT